MANKRPLVAVTRHGSLVIHRVYRRWVTLECGHTGYLGATRALKPPKRMRCSSCADPNWMKGAS